ncbi:hypothetical protein RvY_10954 [Ramazzottius varieornatus]|uniref:Hexosyltransferase n=1 Tax=Ramazzottius varieornatus TaxID=947166 RepID=A0A1D1VEH0_RAMVA|nr:hypothetical protein RvY_10954 [Ramazzottius varieornatus]
MRSQALKSFLAIVITFTASAFTAVFILSPGTIPNLSVSQRFLRSHISVPAAISAILNPTNLPSIAPTTLSSLNGSYQPVYLINEPAICSTGLNSTSHNTFSSPFLLIYIHTKPSHFHRRAFLRHTWADPYFKARFNYSTVFILGDPQNVTVQQKILNESQTFHDIVQADFRDVYENLTLKEISGLHWTTSYCSHTTFVIKADDDLIIKPWFLFEILQKYSNVSSKPSIYCRKWEKQGPHRNKQSKWYVPYSVFPGKVYPPFCSGPSRIMTKSAVQLLFNGTQKLPFFWLEDVFVTGIVAEYMGVERYNEPLFLEDVVARFNAIGSDNLKVAVAHSYGLSNQRRLWKAVTEKFPGYFTGRNLTSFDDGFLDDGE